MDGQKWGRVKELFSSALERQPNQRSAFLREACGEDNSLRAEVESLLSSYSQADSFIEKRTAEPTEITSEDDLPGRRIGSYQVIREIGRGGMAVVYLAVRADDEYRKRVAIKLVKKGLDLDEIPRRFRNERQTLAALDHPNIVKLLDGGSTEEGLPYLVMDYVEGMPITEYCDGRRLSITDRLELFRIVCGAVHYAHQNLVIHRDLKPGNILVTAEGVPKLLDFGIAKLLNPEFSAQTLLVTQPDRRLMTPEYASPEQVRSEPVTTATDVYSLGVLLYELLTGHRPYRLKDQTLQEIERIICEVQPEKPSTVVTRVAEVSSTQETTQTELTPEFVSQSREGRPEKLRRRLLGDLDNVVLMALRKEPQRRYASVEQFSQDIRRHLEGLPVTARPATLGYRASKFMHRHTAGVAAAATVFLILTAGIVFTSREARVARAEKTRADRRFNDVRRLANSFLFEFHNAIANLPGSAPARKLVVDKALEYLNSLSQEAVDDPALAKELATSYLKLGDLQGFAYGNLADLTGALESYRKGITILEKLHQENPKDADASLRLALGYRGTGEALWTLGHVGDAVDSVRKAAEILEVLNPIPEKAPNPFHWPGFALAACYLSLGDKLGNPLLLNLGQVFQSFEMYRKASSILEAMLTTQPSNRELRRAVALSRAKLGLMKVEIGDVAGALDTFRQAQIMLRQLYQEDPVNAQSRADLGDVDVLLGSVLAEAANLGAALKNYGEALSIDEELIKEDPKNVALLGETAFAHWKTREVLTRIGNLQGAWEHSQKGLAIVEGLWRTDPQNVLIRAATAQLLPGLADPLMQLGRREEAREFTLGALAKQKELAERPEVTGGELHIYARTLLTCQPPDLRDPKRARVLAERAAQVTKGENPRALDILAIAYFETGDRARAVETEQKALARLPAAQSPNTKAGLRGEMESNLARFQAANRHR